jgi:hypothetical protein
MCTGQYPYRYCAEKQYLTSKFVDIINWICISHGCRQYWFYSIAADLYANELTYFTSPCSLHLSDFGIMNILGIRFNIINIIISAFIFGLGDDYSLFIMDGL